MTMTDRLDPELAAPLDTFLHLTGGGLNLHDIPATRRTMEEMAEAQIGQGSPHHGHHHRGPAGARA